MSISSYKSPTTSLDPSHSVFEAIPPRRNIPPVHRLSTCWRALGSCSALLTKRSLYAALPNTMSFRLLKLHPGKAGERIKCSLEILPLDGRLPDYEALSYVWSQEPGEEIVYCDGHAISVRRNLFDALQALRDPHRMRMLWADSININQADSEELSSTIRKMHIIYNRASRVVVWIGTDDYDEANPAFALLCTVVNSQPGRSKPAAYSTVMNHNRHSVTCTHAPPTFNSREWRKVMCLFSLHPWFTRMWVLQEIVLARQATVVWGAAELDWDIVGKAVQIIHTKFPRLSLRLEGRAFQNTYIMNALRERDLCSSKKQHPFLHLLDLSRSFDVTEPKDKIYGLLGFPNGEKGYAENAPHDYSSSSVADVYTHVARTIIRKEKHLDVLSFTSHTTADFQNTLNMPSWVPNWTSQSVLYPLMAYGSGNSHRAGKTNDPRRAINIPNNASPIILRLKGTIIATISSHFPNPPSAPPELEAADPHLKALIQWCINAIPDLSPATLAKTLTASRDKDSVLLKSKKTIDTHTTNFCALAHSLSPPLLLATWPTSAPDLATTAVQVAGLEAVREATWRYTCHRNIFTTTRGTELGLGPAAVKPGDVVAVLWGAQTPCVLRRGRGEWWWFVGEAYLEGWMGGEVFGMLEGRLGNRERESGEEGVGKGGGEEFVERVFELR